MKKFYVSFRRLLFGACAAVCLGTVISAVGGIYPYVRERQVNTQLAEQVQKARQKSGDAACNWQVPEMSSGEDRDKEVFVLRPLPQYAALYRENPDLAGWLRIEGTEIDYPVMYTPDEPDYYLHRDYYGEHAFGGCLFIGEGYCTGGGNTIIYGHHMKDGSMFAGLLSYARQEFADKHPLIYFDSVYEEGIYQTVAAFYCDLDEQGQDAFPYYAYSDLSKEEVFHEYISRMKKKNIINTGQEIQFGDQLITLSTCSYHVKNGRFVVAAKKVEMAKK